MIVGMGIDLVELARIRHVYERFGETFLKKFLAPEEMAHMPENILPWLGGRFAAKEAASKALGTGFTDGILPQNLIILNSGTGQPRLFCVEKALEQANRLGARKFHISISHEVKFAIAQVILEN